jgi:hypothetical protein
MRSVVAFRCDRSGTGASDAESAADPLSPKFGLPSLEIRQNMRNVPLPCYDAVNGG